MKRLDMFPELGEFGLWVSQQWRRDDAVGQLVRAFHNEADSSTPDQWKKRLEDARASGKLRSALLREVREWKKSRKEGGAGDPGVGGSVSPLRST